MLLLSYYYDFPSLRGGTFRCLGEVPVANLAAPLILVKFFWSTMGLQLKYFIIFAPNNLIFYKLPS
jgi:hypothetical protein